MRMTGNFPLVRGVLGVGGFGNTSNPADPEFKQGLRETGFG